ncbi:hypothetical protein V6N12_042159 [Hibiscus sabdariffa]|uniref:Uncharacterized protein n=1 Tax=Hibiscus sabdariffa TaxID=183260 RepID=A0ABR2EFJ0_9ROSI
MDVIQRIEKLKHAKLLEKEISPSNPIDVEMYVPEVGSSLADEKHRESIARGSGQPKHRRIGTLDERRILQQAKVLYALEMCATSLWIPVKHLRLWIFECRDPSRDAFKLALGAAALLTLAHVLANLLGGCMCVCSQEEFHRSSANTQLSVACFIFTWIILVVGLSTLVIGILSNEKSKASCGLTHHHFLSIGGIVCFVHGLFSVAYYVSATAASDEGK